MLSFRQLSIISNVFKSLLLLLLLLLIIICKDEHDRVTRLDPDYKDDKKTRLSE